MNEITEEELSKLLGEFNKTEHIVKPRLEDVNEIVGQIDAFVALQLCDEYHIDDIMRALRMYVDAYPTLPHES